MGVPDRVSVCICMCVCARVRFFGTWPESPVESRGGWTFVCIAKRPNAKGFSVRAERSGFPTAVFSYITVRELNSLFWGVLDFVKGRF